MTNLINRWHQTQLLVAILVLLNSNWVQAYLKPVFCTECMAQKEEALNRQTISTSPISDGILFNCSIADVKFIKKEMQNYLRELGIQKNHVLITDDQNGKLFYTLNTPKDDTNTLNLKQRRHYQIKDELVWLPTNTLKKRSQLTVSKKEILMALMQHGRTPELNGSNCQVATLKDHVGIRQNVVAWSENLNWDWPDGESAYWNTQYWDEGTPLKTVSVVDAFRDVFINQKKYSFGCYTASKMVYAHAILDYYSRIKKHAVNLKKVIDSLNQNADPIVGIEPGNMWYFEGDFDPAEKDRPGKLLSLLEPVASKNFIPGDWSYFLNTNPKTYQKTGYEGSNAIYLGRNKFDDFYNDHNHFYTLNEKLDEVFQWRNEVFSRSRDAAKIQKLSAQDYENLTRTPNQGGLIFNFRAVPKWNF